jgi:hypothetical protein
MNNNSNWKISGSLAALGVAALLSGCGSLPGIEDAPSIDLRTSYSGPWAPAVDVHGDPNLRPGAMAMGGLEASAACDYLFIICAAVTVPVAAVTGAVITATDTLPEAEAELLNRITAKAASGLHMPQMFHSVMLSEAIRQGVKVQSAGADVIVEFMVTDLWWEVSIGNQVSLRLTVEAYATHGREFGRRRLGYRGEPAPVEEWLAGGEQHIRDALESFLPEASEAIWLRVLDRD